jgi:DNA-binding MarR family transcriptional regulator
MSTICLPAHILDAAITPRAREVLMLLASHTSAKTPATWICQATMAARLRCSVATIARSIQRLIEAKLIAETGQLHEGRYKFYHVRWSIDENIKAASKKITKPVRKVAISKPTVRANPVEGIQLILPPVIERESPPPAPLSTISPQTIIKDSRIAYFAEIAHKRHQENLQRHKAILAQLRSRSSEDGPDSAEWRS